MPKRYTHKKQQKKRCLQCWWKQKCHSGLIIWIPRTAFSVRSSSSRIRGACDFIFSFRSPCNYTSCATCVTTVCDVHTITRCLSWPRESTQCTLTMQKHCVCALPTEWISLDLALSVERIHPEWVAASIFRWTQKIAILFLFFSFHFNRKSRSESSISYNYTHFITSNALLSGASHIYIYVAPPGAGAIAHQLQFV